MIGHNVKLALRVFGRNRFYAVTSILGLSFGLTIVILISMYVRFELGYESQNPLADRVVRVTMDYLNGDMVIDQDAEAYPPVGPRMQAEFKSVDDFTRAFPITNATIKSRDESLREHNIFVVDPSFLKFFNCQPIAGNLNNALTRPFEMCLTKTAAIKYFGTTDVLDKSLLISGFDQPFKIMAVIADAPAGTHIKYNVLVSRATRVATIGEEKMQWNNNNEYTYLLLSDASQFTRLSNQLVSFNDKLHTEGKIINERIVAQPLKDIHLYSHKSYELEQNGDAVSVYFLMGIGFLVMIIAVVNHINLSTAKSLERAKEVGVRKVIGSSLNQIRGQFFTESLLINVISAVLACGLIVVSLPFFTKVAGLPAGFHSWTDPILYKIIASVVIITTILSSIFPSFVLAGFQPIKAMKGKYSRSAGGVTLRKVLVTVQFSITMFLLVQTFTAKRQLDYMRTKDLGLDIEQTVVIRSTSDDNKNYQVFKDKLLASSEVSAVSFSSCVPGQPTSEMGSTNVNVYVVGGPKPESFNFYITWIDSDFLSTMKIDLVAGSDFIATDKSENNILVNEEALRLWHITDSKSAVGQKINLWGAHRTIVGVVNNFHQSSPKEAFLPMIFMHQEVRNTLTSVRISAGNVHAQFAKIKETYEAIFPGSPFDYFFLDEEFDKQYRADEQFEYVFETLTAFAILISALGLFGLVSVAVANRTKEIGIRKVLGATSQEIMNLVSRDFLGLVFVSVLISATLTYFVVKQWLNRYAFRIDLSLELFVLPALLIITLSMLTIVARTLRASMANPVRSLKED